MSETGSLAEGGLMKVDKANIGRMAKIVAIRNLETGSPSRRVFLGATGRIEKAIKSRNVYSLLTEFGSWEACPENIEIEKGGVL